MHGGCKIVIMNIHNGLEIRVILHAGRARGLDIARILGVEGINGIIFTLIQADLCSYPLVPAGQKYESRILGSLLGRHVKHGIPLRLEVEILAPIFMIVLALPLALDLFGGVPAAAAGAPGIGHVDRYVLRDGQIDPPLLRGLRIFKRDPGRAVFVHGIVNGCSDWPLRHAEIKEFGKHLFLGI